MSLLMLWSGPTLGAPVRASAQAPRIVGLATFEAGQVRRGRAIVGIGALAGVLVSRLEARVSFNRMGAPDGCDHDCFFSDLTIWELGMGVPITSQAGTIRGLVAGVGLGTAREESHRRRITWGPYLTKTWQPSSALALRLEGRFRALQRADGKTLWATTLGLGAGITH